MLFRLHLFYESVGPRGTVFPGVHPDEGDMPHLALRTALGLAVKVDMDTRAVFGGDSLGRFEILPQDILHHGRRHELRLLQRFAQQEAHQLAELVVVHPSMV